MSDEMSLAEMHAQPVQHAKQSESLLDIIHESTKKSKERQRERHCRLHSIGATYRSSNVLPHHEIRLSISKPHTVRRRWKGGDGDRNGFVLPAAFSLSGLELATMKQTH